MDDILYQIFGFVEDSLPLLPEERTAMGQLNIAETTLLQTLNPLQLEAFETYKDASCICDTLRLQQIFYFSLCLGQKIRDRYVPGGADTHTP